MKNESTCMKSVLELAPIGEYRMCQRAVRRLCNPCERCLVRKVARLLAQPLSSVPRSSHGLGPAGASMNAPVVFGELLRILDREGRAKKGSNERSRHEGARPAARNLGIHDASLGHVRTGQRSAA